ncbi:maleylacetoacetate isomerase [Jannaschia rubra]|uniref:maleylacetoacetate isomerase n=1 Tax=Jannaschia rubra TaxID=282197 RepID=UPI002493AB0F|nr:maleylacetoacetate isomerase [Jannaschia rubra]
MTGTVLYDYWRSSASYRVRIALNLAGVEYRAVPVNLVTGQHREPDHLARNPQGLVPVLDIDGHRFTQSLAILDYLEETRRPGLLPVDPVHRAHVRALAHSVAVDVHPVCNLSVVSHVVALTGGGDDTRRDWMQHFIAPGLASFERLAAGFDAGPFCCGETPSLADVCLMPQLYNADRWGVDTTPYPRLRAAAEMCARHPAFAAAHPDAVRT